MIFHGHLFNGWFASNDRCCPMAPSKPMAWCVGRADGTSPNGISGFILGTLLLSRASKVGNPPNGRVRVSAQSDVKGGKRQGLGSGWEIYKKWSEGPKPVLPKIVQTIKTRCALSQTATLPLCRTTPKAGKNKPVVKWKSRGSNFKKQSKT